MQRRSPGTVELVNRRDLGDVASGQVFAVPFVARSPKTKYAPVMELVDMRDLGSRAFSVWVRVPSGAPRRRGLHIVRDDFLF